MRLDPKVLASVAAGRVLALMPASIGAHVRRAQAPGPSNGTADVTTVGVVGVVSVLGPLEQRAGFAADCAYVDGYDAIEARFAEALASQADGVQLVVDSPGGIVAGLGEAAVRMRAAAVRSGKPVVAYVDELAASAGYWLATVADEIHLPESAGVGSVGTYTLHVDHTGELAQAGLGVEVIGSPDGKGPTIGPLSDVKRAELQGEIDTAAKRFFQAVGERRGLSPEAVKGWDAKVFYGSEAVAMGAADRVLSIDGSRQRLATMASERRMEKEISALLAQPADASPAQMAQAATAAKPIMDLGRAALALHGTADPSEAMSRMSADREAARQWAEHSAAMVQSRAVAEAEERRNLVAGLVARGVVPPVRAKRDGTLALTADNLSEPWASMDLGMLRAISEQATTTVPGSVSAPVVAGDATALTPEEVAVASQVGVTLDQMRARKAELAKREH